MKFFNYFTLVVAVAISICSAYYSIVGLTAIFSGSFWPIVIMGTVLELGKITTAVWLHIYWQQARWWVRLYLVPAVAILMLVTSMGIFGFLSKAHLDATAGTTDTALQVELIQNKITREESKIKDNNTVLAQLDQAVQTLTDAQRIRGADGAIAVRESQKEERELLSSNIDASYEILSQLQEEKLKLESEAAKLAAEVGPIKYVASLLYGNNPTTDALEDAVRWMIILLVAVFDPLAVVMVLAAAAGLAHSSSRKEPNVVIQEKIVEVEKVVEVPVEKIVEVERFVTDDESLKEAKGKIANLEDELAFYHNGAQAEIIKELNEEVSRLLDELAFYKSNNVAGAIKAEADDVTVTSVGTTSFGTTWPSNPVRGDLFLKIDATPNILYKWNSRKWIEIDRARVDDALVYDTDYIDFLIQQIRKGHQDYENLTELEQKQIVSRIKESNS